MSVTVVCECASTFDLKDEFAGKTVQCPNCGATMVAGGHDAAAGGDPIFGRSVFLLRQKAVSINQKYFVSDEQGQPLLFVERPAHLLRGLFALLCGCVAATFTFFVLAIVLPIPAEESALGTVVALFILALSGTAFLVVGMGLSKKRHVTFYRGADASAPRVMEILQDNKIRFPTHTFTVRDENGATIGVLSKNYLYNLFRKQWWIREGRGRPVCLVREDSIVLSLLRRFLGPLFGMLRTNFVFHQFGSLRELGEFRRKLTILDRYVLDLSSDGTRLLDRRLAVATAVMLDTGERR